MRAKARAPTSNRRRSAAGSRPAGAGPSWGRGSPAMAATHTSSVNTSRSAITAALGSSPSKSTTTRPGRSGRSSAAAGTPAAAVSSWRTRCRWWPTSRSDRSRRVAGAVAPGTSSPAGGWKWIPFGAGRWTGRPESAKRLGDTPCARAKARENAAREP